MRWRRKTELIRNPLCAQHLHKGRMQVPNVSHLVNYFSFTRSLISEKLYTLAIKYFLRLYCTRKWQPTVVFFSYLRPLFRCIREKVDSDGFTYVNYVLLNAINFIRVAGRLECLTASFPTCYNILVLRFLQLMVRIIYYKQYLDIWLHLVFIVRYCWFCKHMSLRCTRSCKLNITLSYSILYLV